MKIFFLLLTLIFSIDLKTNNVSIKKGKENYFKYMCNICHGDLNKNSNNNYTNINDYYPQLSNQNSEYLYKQILDIKKGNRNNSLSSMMKPYLNKITEKEIEDISIFLENLN